MVVVEKLGIQHSDLEITGPRVIRFRDAIVGLLVAEMEAPLSQKARVGFATMLNYVGGSCMFIRRREFEIRMMLTRATDASAGCYHSRPDLDGPDDAKFAMLGNLCTLERLIKVSFLSLPPIVN